MNAFLPLLLAALPLRAPSIPQEAPSHPALEGCNERWRAACAELGAGAVALAVVEGDQVVHRFTWGRRDPERDLPVTPQTVFYIASATKPFVALALMQLVEQDKVRLDAPVREYLPRFRLRDPEATERITVRQLLCHSAGLNSFPIVLLDAYTGEITEDRYYHFLERVEPAGATTYSNLHFTLLGRIVEAVSGSPWREYLREHVFEPAGMTRTSGYASWMYGQDDVALPAIEQAGRVVRAAQVKSDRTMHAAGGLGTTVEDAARWLRLQLGRGRIEGTRLLEESSLEEMFAPQSQAGGGGVVGVMQGFGLGWQRGTYRGQRLLGHGGGYVGCASWIGFLPELELGLVFLGTGEDGAQAAMQLIATDVLERFLSDEALADPLPELLRSVASRKARLARGAGAAREAFQSALAPEAFRGPWRNEWFGTLRFEVETSQAWLGEMAMTLVGKGPDAFELLSDGAKVAGRFRFAGERVTGVELDLIEDAPSQFE